MKRDSDYGYYDTNKAPRHGYEGGGRGRGPPPRDGWTSRPYYSDRDDYGGRDYHRGPPSRGPPRGPGGGGGRGRGGRGRLAGKPPVFPLPEEPVLVQDIPVKKEHAGAVIGVGGERVKKLREETGCKVHIKKTTPETLQIVELTGRLSEIDMAISALQRIVNDVEPGYTLELPTKYSCYIDIYPDMVGCVIGRHGDRVKQVKQESGAHVRVEDQQSDSDFQVVSIMGELDQVRAAYKMVASNLDAFDPHRVKHRPMRPYPSEYPQYGGSGPPPRDDPYGPPPAGPEFSNFSYANPTPIVAASDFAAPGAVFAPAALDPTVQVQQPAMLGGTVVAGGPAGAASTIVVNPGAGGAGQAATPQVLVLQPDGTYKPVQAVVYSVPHGQAAAAPVLAQQQPQPAQMMIPQALQQPQQQLVKQEPQPLAQQQPQPQQQLAPAVSPVSLAGLTAALPAGARIISLSSLQDPATSSALTQLISPSSAMTINTIPQNLMGQLFNQAAYAQAQPAAQQGLTQIVAQSGYS